MNLKKLESIKLSPEMNQMVLEALMSKDDNTSMYATKLIMELTHELAMKQGDGSTLNQH